MRSWLIGVVVFIASAAILVLEIVAGRILAPYVGVTLQSFTAIIGTVLAGIAFGAWAGGRIADRFDPIAALGPVLAVGGVLSVVSPSIVYLVGPNLVGSSSVQTIFLAAIGFLAPAAVLAMVTPLAAKAILTDLDSTGAVVGSLSALGTAGALFGTFITGFVLIAAVPSKPITWTVGIVLIVLAVNVTVPWSRKWVAMGGVVLALSILGSAAIANTCESESAYYCVRVEQDTERPSGRILVLDTAHHSYVDLDDPTYLGFRYARLMASVIDVEFQAQPIDALFIGGGGFTLPRYLQEVNGGTSTVLELDPALVTISEEQLGLVPGPWLRIEVGDARLTLRGEPSSAYDVVVGDAFSSLSVPWHLTTEEFLIELRDKMAPSGIYIMNVIDRPQAMFVHAELQTLGRVFPHIAVSAPQAYLDLVRGGNFVLIASTQPFDTAAIEAALPEGEEILFDSDALDWSNGGQILTDEFAPTDQLFQR
jgi:spermidine synthase